MALTKPNQELRRELKDLGLDLEQAADEQGLPRCRGSSRPEADCEAL